ncbi:MAG: hypothetical protein GC201_05515 [Alphaproteobacteria bacterium]|nr:hypothetical protein [Alphaproteobacteria bacterium]
MKTQGIAGWARAAAGAVLLALAGCASTPNVEKVAADTWTEARTPNFVVITNAGPVRARYLAENLEDFRRLVIEATNLDIQSNPMPFHIVALSTGGQFRALVDAQQIFGAFQQSYRGGLAVVNLTARAPDGTDSLEIIRTPYGPIYRAKQNSRAVGMDGVFHEYVHYLLEIDKRRRYPLWFHEGYAEYLSTLQIGDDGRYRVGEPPMHRVLALQTARWIPLGALLNARSYDTGYENGDFNAEAWLVVHYMMDDPDRRQKLYAFLDRLDRPTIDAVPVFEDVFGRSVDEVTRALRQYQRIGHFDTTTFDRSPAPLPRATLRTLAPAEADEELAFTLLHFSRARDRGEVLLKQALALDPDNLKARALLAAVAITDDRPGDAGAILDAAGSKLDESPDLLVMKAELVLRRAIRQVADSDSRGPATAAEAAGLYRKALGLDPDQAQAMLGLARCALITPGRPPDSVLDAIDHAQALLPTNTDIALIKAHVLLKRGQIEAAAETYERVIAWARQPEIARQARERLAAINGAPLPLPEQPLYQLP